MRLKFAVYAVYITNTVTQARVINIHILHVTETETQIRLLGKRLRLDY